MAAERINSHAGGVNGRALPEADRLIADLACRQRGRVKRAQLLTMGLGPKAIEHRLACGRLLSEHDGVYAVGYRSVDLLGRCGSALLAVGDDGALSHLAAAAIVELGPDPIVIDVTCPRRLRSRDGIRLHHRVLEPRELHHRHGLPLTSPARTLFDLAGLLPLEQLARKANEAFVQRLCTIADLHETLDRNRRRRGAVAFRRLIDALDPDGRIIRSPLEARLNSFLRARGFPPWESNARLRIGDDVVEPDVLWRDQRVIVEADGRDPHLSPLTFASDRRRDRRLSAEGWRPVRVTARDLGSAADELDADLRTLLGLASSDFRSPEPAPRAVRPTLR